MQLCLHGPSSLGLDPRKRLIRSPTDTVIHSPTDNVIHIANRQRYPYRQPIPLSISPTDNVIHIAENCARASKRAASGA